MLLLPGTVSYEVQEGCVWETLGANLSEVRTFLLGGNEVSFTPKTSCGLCNFVLPMAWLMKPSGGD